MGSYATQLGLPSLDIDLAKTIWESLDNEMLGEDLITDSEVCGSVRREVPRVNDIDIQVIRDEDEEDVLLWLAKHPKVEQILRQGDTICSVLFVLEPVKVVIDMYVTTEEAWGAHMMFLTGSQTLNIQQRIAARERGWRLSQNGLFSPDGTMFEGSERGIYDKMGWTWLEPKDRNLF